MLSFTLLLLQKNVVYLITCSKCNAQYVGQTTRHLSIRMNEHRSKCKNNDKTFLISSHSLSFVEKFCDKALWLKHGNQMAYGDIATVIEKYRDSK